VSKTGVPLKLVGEDANAFSILGRAQRALKSAGKGEFVEAFHTEATSGDYSHLLMVTMQWFDVDLEEEEADTEECVCCSEPSDGEYCDQCYNNNCVDCEVDEDEEPWEIEK